MASAATATDEDVPKPAVKVKKTGGSPLLAIALAVVVSTAASAGVSFMLTRHALAAAAHADDAAAEGGDDDKAAAEKPKEPPNYLPLDPAFVVNLEADDTRFLQVQVQLMTRDAHAVDTLKLHEPRIRNALLMLFSQQHPADIATLEGKQKLQAESLDQIQKILVEETGKPLVEAVYFTSFVTQ